MTASSGRMNYKNYLLLVLMVVLSFSYVERTFFGMVLEHIKLDLHLTDTQLGILSGVGFALFFAVLGIPIARWADGGNRVTIVWLTTVVWSAAVILCGMAGTFLQLFLIRIWVAAGEAGCTPPANSLIPEYFSRSERPRAVARYMAGISLGLMVGYFAGGWLNELYGWRKAFFIIGFPGVALTALTATTLKEPRYLTSALLRDSTQVSTHEESQPSIKEVMETLSGNATFRHLLFFCSVWYFTGWGITQWLPTFFIRSHGMDTGALGTWLAAIYGGVGILGTWLGGALASRYAARNERLQLLGVTVLFVLEGVFNAVSVIVPNHHVAFGALALGYLCEGVAYGPVFATLQTLVPARMRSTAQAIMGLLPNFFGMGFGPLTVGALSDALHPWAGNESLRYTLILFCPGYCWAAAHLWRASQTVARDLQHTHGPENASEEAPIRLAVVE